MSLTDLFTLLPLIILSTASVVIMLVIAFYRNYRVTSALTLLGIGMAFLSLPLVSSSLPRQVTRLLIIDDYALFYIGLLLAGSFAVVLLSYSYMEKYEGQREEYYLLLLLATLGSIVLVVSNHFISFFLGLEILSVSLYTLIAYPRSSQQMVEAGIKYMILAGATSAFLLFGMSLIYATFGTMEFAGTALSGPAAANFRTVLLVGWGLMLVGIGFKLALVPFHMWTPDVYQGAPAPVTGFIATVSKGGMFALLVRYFTQVSIYEDRSLWSLFAIIAIASMLLGNLLALVQDNVKRILAYSSIAHLGYLLVAFLAGGDFAPTAIAFYLVAYFVTILIAFGIITLLSTPQRESAELEDYRGLFQRSPWLTFIFTAALLSLAGIPPTAGLIAKIYVAAAGVASALWLLLSILIISSIIGVFYYLRVVITMFRPPPAGEQLPAPIPSLPTMGRTVLVILVFLLVGLGVYPTPLIKVITAMVTNLR